MTTHRSFRLSAMPDDEPICEPPSTAKGKYFRAIGVAVAQQAPILILAALMLDGGRILRICTIAAIASWICTLMILLRRPKQPTNCDIAIVNYGFWAAMFLILITERFLWLFV